MDDPQSSVAQMIGRMLRQSHVRIEQGKFEPDEEAGSILRHIASSAELQDKTLQGHGYLMLAECMWHSGQPKMALEHFQTAEQFYRDGKNYSNVIVALAQCADVYRVMGDLQSAFDLVKEGEHIVNAFAIANHTGAISLLYAIRGLVRLDEGDNAAASKDFDLVFRVHERQSQDHTFAANLAWRGIAEINLRTGQMVTAWSIFRLAREAADRSGNPVQRYAAYALGARLAQHDGDLATSADDYASIAENTLAEVEVAALRAILLIQQVRHYAQLGDSATACRMLEQSAAFLQMTDAPDLMQLVTWMLEQFAE